MFVVNSVCSKLKGIVKTTKNSPTSGGNILLLFHIKTRSTLSRVDIFIPLASKPDHVRNMKKLSRFCRIFQEMETS